MIYIYVYVYIWLHFTFFFEYTSYARARGQINSLFKFVLSILGFYSLAYNTLFIAKHARNHKVMPLNDFLQTDDNTKIQQQQQKQQQSHIYIYLNHFFMCRNNSNSHTNNKKRFHSKYAAWPPTALDIQIWTQTNRRIHTTYTQTQSYVIHACITCCLA